MSYSNPQPLTTLNALLLSPRADQTPSRQPKRRMSQQPRDVAAASAPAQKRHCNGTQREYIDQLLPPMSKLRRAQVTDGETSAVVPNVPSSKPGRSLKTASLLSGIPVPESRYYAMYNTRRPLPSRQTQNFGFNLGGEECSNLTHSTFSVEPSPPRQTNVEVDLATDLIDAFSDDDQTSTLVAKEDTPETSPDGSTVGSPACVVVATTPEGGEEQPSTTALDFLQAAWKRAASPAQRVGVVGSEPRAGVGIPATSLLANNGSSGVSTSVTNEPPRTWGGSVITRPGSRQSIPSSEMSQVWTAPSDQNDVPAPPATQAHALPSRKPPRPPVVFLTHQEDDDAAPQRALETQYTPAQSTTSAAPRASPAPSPGLSTRTAAAPPSSVNIITGPSSLASNDTTMMRPLPAPRAATGVPFLSLPLSGLPVPTQQLYAHAVAQQYAHAAGGFPLLFPPAQSLQAATGHGSGQAVAAMPAAENMTMSQAAAMMALSQQFFARAHMYAGFLPTPPGQCSPDK